MLVQLIPDQIDKFWELIQYAVEQARPPEVGDSVERDTNILNALMTERMHCWVDYVPADNGDGPKINLVVLTTITDDACSGTRSLLVYSLFGLQKLSEETWRSGIETLRRWGGAMGCQKLVAYTNSQAVLTMTERMGFNSDYTLVSTDCVQ